MAETRCPRGLRYLLLCPLQRKTPSRLWSSWRQDWECPSQHCVPWPPLDLASVGTFNMIDERINKYQSSSTEQILNFSRSVFYTLGDSDDPFVGFFPSVFPFSGSRTKSLGTVPPPPGSHPGLPSCMDPSSPDSVLSSVPWTSEQSLSWVHWLVERFFYLGHPKLLHLLLGQGLGESVRDLCGFPSTNLFPFCEWMSFTRYQQTPLWCCVPRWTFVSFLTT